MLVPYGGDKCSRYSLPGLVDKKTAKWFLGRLSFVRTGVRPGKEVARGKPQAKEYFISTTNRAQAKQASKSSSIKSNTAKDKKTAYQQGAKQTAGKAIKKVKKHHHIAVHVMVFITIASLLVLGGRRTTNEPTAPSYSFGTSEAPVAVDEVSSADVAASIAREANLIVADNVQNLSDSLNAQVDFAATADEYVSKPQIVATNIKTKDDITSYVTQEGDTIPIIAEKFNVTSDTIRWVNDITGDIVTPGTELTILPVSGVLHTVSGSDTAGSIASHYGANEQQVVAFNDLELTGIKEGQEVIVPNGEEPAPAAPVYFSSAAPATSSVFAFGSEALYGGNGYSYGYCTWHAANRRNEIGRPIPRNLGNAVTWAGIASAAGLGVGEAPQSGAVLWHKNTYIAGGYGHVAFVESVNPDGSAVVSDMNYPSWGVATTRTVPASEMSQYLFIY